MEKQVNDIGALEIPLVNQKVSVLEYSKDYKCYISTILRFCDTNELLSE